MGKTNTTLNKFIKFFVITLIPLNFISSCITKKEPLPEWIIGNWQAKVNGIQVNEKWQINNDVLSAQTSTFYHKKTQIVNISMELIKDTLYYHVSKEKTCFTCGDPRNDTLVFVNSSNPFPKRIVYTKPQNNVMNVWIENFEGDPNRIDYHFKKIN